MDLQEAFDAGFDAVKAYVDRSFDDFGARLVAMEARINGIPLPKEIDTAAICRLVDVEVVIPRIKAIQDVQPNVDVVVAPLLKRIEDLEAKATQPADVGKDDIAAIVADVDSLRKAVGEWKAPEPVVLPDFGDMIAKAFASIRVPEDGKDADPAVVKQMVDAAVALLPPAEKGKDADPEQVAALVKSEAERILAGWERPQDGKSITLEQIVPLIDEAVSKAVSARPAPKDGADVAGGTIDRDGHLIITLSNGQTKDFGLVVGRDGIDADMSALERSIVEKVGAIPLPKDGLDGVGFDDMDFEVREDGCYLVWFKGETVKEARLPIPVDRGVYKEGQTYRKGDGVTWGGSFWFAQEETTEKPDSGKGWRLSVKKGRNGKDGILKPAPKTEPVKI